MERLLSFLAIALVCVHCGDGGDRTADSQTGEFGIFLTKEDVPPSSLIVLSYIEPADEPVVSLDDIEVYIRKTHALVLAESGRNRLDSLQVPVRGRSFLVCVDGHPRYDGAFWTPISSLSFAGAVILLPVMNDTIRIQLGYPEDIDPGYEDPRGHAEVMAALAKAGKLR